MKRIIAHILIFAGVILAIASVALAVSRFHNSFVLTIVGGVVSEIGFYLLGEEK